VPNCPTRIRACERVWCESRTEMTRIRASAADRDPLTLITSKRKVALYGGPAKYVRVDSRPLPDR